ncbi:MAG TPA: Hsp20/alpha crystallin family protein [Bacteroidota bacterium]|nr:Hsp20/alpha crystallin family protein [Bacteroidota bacterium]
MLARFETYPSFNPLVGELFFEDPFEATAVADTSFAPPLDVAENGEEIVVVAEVPGVKKEDVKISLEKGILSIGGEKKSGARPENARGLVSEQHQGKFLRTIRLPYEVNAAGVSAELADGLLRIVLPKAEAAKAHEISVR